MIRSMTGFASLERSYDFGRLTWEIRTVNHRFLEYSLRLPEEFRALEPAMRDCMGQRVSRGKVDATLRLAEAQENAGGRLRLNSEVVNRLLELHAETRGLTGQSGPPDAMQLLRWPGAVEDRPPDREPLQEAAMALLEEAIGQLYDGRRREGEQLAAVIDTRLDGVSEWVGRVRDWLPDIRTALRQKVLDRVSELELPLEPGRLEQEVALLAQKMDVDEELDRLDAHVAEAKRTLKLEEPVGRRLDFLMQEFNRESNTLSSKSVDQRTTQAALELKVLIEQMREQVQNVE